MFGFWEGSQRLPFHYFFCSTRVRCLRGALIFLVRDFGDVKDGEEKEQD